VVNCWGSDVHCGTRVAQAKSGPIQVQVESHQVKVGRGSHGGGQEIPILKSTKSHPAKIPRAPSSGSLDSDRRCPPRLAEAITPFLLSELGPPSTLWINLALIWPDVALAAWLFSLSHCSRHSAAQLRPHQEYFCFLFAVGNAQHAVGSATGAIAQLIRSQSSLRARTNRHFGGLQQPRLPPLLGKLGAAQARCLMDRLRPWKITTLALAPWVSALTCQHSRSEPPIPDSVAFLSRLSCFFSGPKGGDLDKQKGQRHLQPRPLTPWPIGPADDRWCK